MTSLEGVVDEWDNSDVVRQRMRDHNRLLLPPPLKAGVSINVQCGEFNFEVLKPLAKRLQDPAGTVSMHTVPALQHQPLGVLISSNV